MKRIITITILCLGAIAMFAQPAMKVASSGLVGLNEADPQARLHITDGDILIDNGRFFNQFRSDNSPQQVFGMDPGDDMTINRGSIIAGQNSSMLLGVGAGKKVWVFGPAVTNLFEIDQATGNVGIGVANPSFKLAVNGTAAKAAPGDWSGISDKRAKKNIVEFEDGLEEVLQIRPVTYSYNGKFGSSDDGSTHVGVLAQEIQKIAPYTVTPMEFTEEKMEYSKETGLKSKIVDRQDYLTYNGTAITYMLVNSIQEQQSIIENQNDRIEKLERMLEDILENQSSVLEADLESTYDSKLQQNVPNPFNSETSIAYSLANNVSNAELVIYNISGELIKEISIAERGEGKINLKASNLASGTYSYSLIADGKVISSSKMIKSN